MDKPTLRRQIARQKSSLSVSQIVSASVQLADRLLALPVYRRSQSIYTYLSFNQEVRTLPIIVRAMREGKRVAVPRVEERRLCFAWLEDDTALRLNAWGIPEPQNAVRADDEAALLLLPGLAFDVQGHRVGYGGGYYDRFLAAEPLHPTVALCYDFQKLAAVPFASHDKTADILLTAPTQEVPL